MPVTPQAHEIPILKMTDSLGAVYRFCAQSQDPVVASLGEICLAGQAEDTCLGIAAEIAHWLASQPSLMAKEKLRVTLPMWGDEGFDEIFARHLAGWIGRSVAVLLGRDPENIHIEVMETILHGLVGQAPVGCFNGIWNKDRRPGQQTSDAIWLRDMDAKILLDRFCFSDDLGKAIFAGVPVGMSADNEIELVKLLNILRFTGFFVGATPLRSRLTGQGHAWDSYQHSQDCMFADTSSFIVSITGAADEALGSKELRERVALGHEILESFDALAENGVEATPDRDGLYWIASPGCILKSRFDNDSNERYQVLCSDWMVRMSDGAILGIRGG